MLLYIEGTKMRNKTKCTLSKCSGNHEWGVNFGLTSLTLLVIQRCDLVPQSTDTQSLARDTP